MTKSRPIRLSPEMERMIRERKREMEALVGRKLTTAEASRLMVIGSPTFIVVENKRIKLKKRSLFDI